MLITRRGLAVVGVDWTPPSTIWPTHAGPPRGASASSGRAGADREVESTATSARRSIATTRAGVPPAVTDVLPRTAWATVTTRPAGPTHPVATSLTARQPEAATATVARSGCGREPD